MLLIACKTSRHAERRGQKQPASETVKPAPGTPVPTTPITPATTPSSQQPQNALQPYTWVNYRGTANVDFDGKKYQCSYYMVNRVDSILYLNLSMMGIELARLVATPAEVIFVNKLSSEYYKGDYAFVEKYLKAKADFYTLQAIFNGDESKLKAIPGLSVSYHPIIDATSGRPFFDSFNVSMNNGQRKADVQVKVLKFNTPGPTGIKIPEGFNEMKL